MSATARLCSQEIPVIVDGSQDLPVVSSCFQLVKPGLEEVNRHSTLDVLPLIFEEAAFPMEEEVSFQTAHGQNVCGLSMLSEEDKTNSKCASQLAVLSFVELPVSPKKQMCLDTQLNCQNFIGLQMESAETYSPCIVDINIDMKNFEKPIETVGSIKSESLITGVLQRQASLKTCGRFMQLFSNPGSSLLKFISKEKSFNERVHDIPNNRWRKYKRAASFDSRNVVLLFSIMSSLGTLILIYLTLRVRQTAEGFVNV